MIKTACHCGQVQLEITKLPDSLTRCNCSICRRYSSLWGYHSNAQVKVISNDDALDSYTWGDECIDFLRCKRCGCVTHYTCRPKAAMDRVGVNYSMMEADVIAELPIRNFDGAKM